MGGFGISLYPEHSTPERDKEYLRLAGKYGFRRIFTCLLNVKNKNKDELINKFRDMIDTAHECGMEGLCTLEMHRGLPVAAQVRHLLATGMVDDVIIANAYASEEELKACAAVPAGKLMFGLCLEKELTETEREILFFDRQHVIRSDLSEYMIRSVWPRAVFAERSVPPANTRDLKRGDVVILNDGYFRYKGELHVVLKAMPNDGRKNVIGHIPDYERVLLDYIEPWRIFSSAASLFLYLHIEKIILTQPARHLM